MILFPLLIFFPLLITLLTRWRLLKSLHSFSRYIYFCFRVPLASFSLFNGIELFQAAIDRSLFTIREFRNQLEISSVRFSFDDQFRSRSRSLARPRLNYSVFMDIGFQWTFSNEYFSGWILWFPDFLPYECLRGIVLWRGIFKENVWYKLEI